MGKQDDHPSRNSLSRLFAMLAFFVVAGVTAIVGVFILAVVIGLGAILAVVVPARVWWLRRRLRHSGDKQIPGSGATIEGDYRRHH